MAEQGNGEQKLGINGYKPRGPFLDFHERPQRWGVMVAHRRAGKTVACVADLILSALFCKKNDGRFAYISPQFNQSKDIAWNYVKRLTADIPAMDYNETELRADLPNGARVRLYGADNPDRLRGIYLDGVILDEFGDMKPRVWGEVVRPLLADRQGWAAFIGTPKGKNEFWDVWKRAQADESWFKLKLPASTSGLISADELADAAKGMTVDQVEQEFECSFEAAIVGAYWGKELRELEKAGRIRAVPYDPAAPVHTAWDLGYRDDTAIWWYQVIGGEIHVIDHHASSGLSVDYYVQLVRSKPYRYGQHWLPHDARAKTLASGGKSIEEMVANGLGIGTIRIVPGLDVQDGIQAARVALGRSWFDQSNCEEGLEALRQYQREWDEDKKAFRERPRHDWTSHSSDSWRYLSIAWREEYKAKEPDPTKFPSQLTYGELVKWSDNKQSVRRRI